MSDIGISIKEVLADLTTPCTVIDINGNEYTDEYLDHEMYYEQSTEFIRQFCFSGTHSYDSKVDYGALLVFHGDNYLVLNVKNSEFKGEIIDKSTFFITCNIDNGLFSEYTKTRDSKLDITEDWIPRVSGIVGLQTDSMTTRSEITEGVVSLSNSNDVLYIPKNILIKIGYRFYPDTNDLTEYYVVESIQKRKFKNCFVIKLGSDAR